MLRKMVNIKKNNLKKFFLSSFFSKRLIELFHFISLRCDFVCVYGHVQKHDGAVEQPQWCQLL